MIRLIFKYILESLVYSYREVKDFLKSIPIVNAIVVLIFIFLMYFIIWLIPLALEHFFNAWILGILIDIIFVIFMMCSLDTFFQIWDNRTEREDYQEYMKKKKNTKKDKE